MTAGNGRLLDLNGEPVGGLPKNAKDAHGRFLRHNATVYDAHAIAVEEGNAVLDFHFKQLPPFILKMIQDVLLNFGLVELDGTNLRPSLAGLQACPDCGSVTRVLEGVAASQCLACTSPARPVPLMRYQPPTVPPSNEEAGAMVQDGQSASTEPQVPENAGGDKATPELLS